MTNGYSKKKTLRLQYHIKLYKNGEVIHSVNFHKKSGVIARALLVSWDKAYLRVRYTDDFHNDCTVTTREDFRWHLDAFTEKSLVEYALGKKGVAV